MKKLLLVFFIFTLFPSFSQGAVIQFTGAETGGLTGETSSTSGTISVVATPKHGSYGYRANPTGSAIGYTAFRSYLASGAYSGVFGITNMYFEGWVRVDTCPASKWEEIAYGFNTSGADKFFLNLNSDCTLTLRNQAGTGIATTTAVLSSSFKLLKLRIDAGTSAAYEVNIDGIAITGNGDFTVAGFREFRFGKTANLNDNSVDVYFDSLVFNSTTYIDTTYQILPLIANGDGIYQAWTGAGGSSYTQVDDVPHDGTTTDSRSTTNGDINTYDVQDTSTANITGTVESLKYTIHARETTTATTDFRGKIISGATEANLTANNPASNYNGNAIGQVYNTDPNTGSLWTLAAVDAAEIGGTATDQSTTQLNMTQVMVHVLFIPGASAIDALKIEGKSLKIEGKSLKIQG